jgi:hypothetical protein
MLHELYGKKRKNRAPAPKPVDPFYPSKDRLHGAGKALLVVAGAAAVIFGVLFVVKKFRKRAK